jgi:hypothetical protein
MLRAVSVVAVLLSCTVASSVYAQVPVIGMSGPMVVGGYGAYGPYFGSGRYSISVGYGYGPYAAGYGYGDGFGYGAFDYRAFLYGQQLYQQQSLQTQQIFQAQQTALLARLEEAKERVDRLDALKEQLFVDYLKMNDAEKAKTRLDLMNTYVLLDPHDREGWKRDAVVQILIGDELPRLDAYAEYRTMDPADQARFRQQLVAKYRIMPDTEQAAWRNDPIVASILGKDWWLP